MAAALREHKTKLMEALLLLREDRCPLMLKKSCNLFPGPEYTHILFLHLGKY